MTLTENLISFKVLPVNFFFKVSYIYKINDTDLYKQLRNEAHVDQEKFQYVNQVGERFSSLQLYSMTVSKCNINTNQDNK